MAKTELTEDEQAAQDLAEARKEEAEAWVAAHPEDTVQADQLRAAGVIPDTPVDKPSTPSSRAKTGEQSPAQKAREKAQEKDTAKSENTAKATGLGSSSTRK
jgi:hypothetical protein